MIQLARNCKKYYNGILSDALGNHTQKCLWRIYGRRGMTIVIGLILFLVLVVISDQLDNRNRP
jgi:hypothetical protein